MVSVSPNHRLADGQTVTVEGTDLVPGQTVYVYECQDPYQLCTKQLAGTAVADEQGRVSITTTVRRWIYDFMADSGDLPTDCSVATCHLALALRGYYEDGYEPLVSTDLDFAPTPAIFTSDSTWTWEGDTGTHPIEVRFGVTPASRAFQVVRYRTYRWSADASDFVPAAGIVTLPPGATEGSVTIDVRGDTAVEGDELFLVEFRGTRRLSQTRAFAVVRIADDWLG